MVDLSKVPDAEILAEAKKRREKMREKFGPYAPLKKFRKCKGCGKMFHIRALRSHECTISWKLR